MANQVRRLRKQHLMTLEALAERAGVTKSYLSKVERGQSTPSIAVAIKLAHALDVDLESLFTTPGEPGTRLVVTPAAQRRPLTPAGKQSESFYEGIAMEMSAKRMAPFMLQPPHDVSRVAFRDHPGEELIFVHEGRAQLLFPSHVVELAAGDSLYFDATIPHKARSLGETRAQLLLVVCDERDDPGTTKLVLP